MRIVAQRVVGIACAAVFSMAFSHTGAAQAPPDTPIEVENQPVYHATMPVKPPAAKHVTKSEAGRAGGVWVAGFWSLQGDPQTAPRAGWVWVPGRWLQPPVPGARWDDAHWGWHDKWWTWIPGHWDEPTRHR